MDVCGSASFVFQRFFMQQENNKKMSVLFVCMGNICRSPTAEGMFRRILRQHAPKLEIYVDSAGTHSYHVGEAPDLRAQEAARNRGVDISQLTARKISEKDFLRFQFILAMDQENFAFLYKLSPAEYQSRIHLFLDYAPKLNKKNVPDPYYGNGDGFERVLDLVEEASMGLLKHLGSSV